MIIIAIESNWKHSDYEGDYYLLIENLVNYDNNKKEKLYNWLNNKLIKYDLKYVDSGSKYDFNINEFLKIQEFLNTTDNYLELGQNDDTDTYLFPTGIRLHKMNCDNIDKL